MSLRKVWKRTGVAAVSYTHLSDAPRSQARESRLNAVDWLFYAICVAVPVIALSCAYFTGYWHWAFTGTGN